MQILKNWKNYSDDELYLRTRGIVVVCNVLFWVMVFFGSLDFMCFIFSVCRQLNTFIVLFLVIGLIIMFFIVGIMVLRYVILEVYEALRDITRKNLKRIEIY